MSTSLAELKGFRGLCKDIERREKKINSLAMDVTDVVQSAADDPFCLHSVSVRGTVYPPGTETARARLMALKAKRERIERAVDEIPNDRIRYAVIARYIDPCYGELPTWETIADMLDDGRSGDALRQAVSRYFQGAGKVDSSND